MTIKELYEAAKERNSLDYEVCFEVDTEIATAAVAARVAEFDKKQKLLVLS